MFMQKMNIKNLSPGELSHQISKMGEKPYRHTQIMHWLYQKGIRDFDSMTNLPKSLRNRLDKKFLISALEPLDSVESSMDGSKKILLRARGNSLIEIVIMETHGYQTVCISSQVGCPLGCRFCRTGAAGFERNLDSDEILNQF
jgi:23S rRNA (adenine2503-C2)-methyltransferase